MEKNVINCFLDKINFKQIKMIFEAEIGLELKQNLCLCIRFDQTLFCICSESMEKKLQRFIVLSSKKYTKLPNLTYFVW